MPGNRPFETWDDVVAFALSLPDTELSTSYGRPAVKVRGKAFAYPGREQGSFALSTPLGEKELLMETEPDTFWETPHYRGWPAVLVRYGSPSRERSSSACIGASGNPTRSGVVRNSSRSSPSGRS